jgi:hypothetical protein
MSTNIDNINKRSLSTTRQAVQVPPTRAVRFASEEFVANSNIPWLAYEDITEDGDPSSSHAEHDSSESVVDVENGLVESSSEESTSKEEDDDKGDKDLDDDSQSQSVSTVDSAEAREAAIRAGIFGVLMAYLQNDIFQRILALLSHLWNCCCSGNNEKAEAMELAQEALMTESHTSHSLITGGASPSPNPTAQMAQAAVSEKT